LEQASGIGEIQRQLHETKKMMVFTGNFPGDLPPFVPAKGSQPPAIFRETRSTWQDRKRRFFPSARADSKNVNAA